MLEQGQQNNQFPTWQPTTPLPTAPFPPLQNYLYDTTFLTQEQRNEGLRNKCLQYAVRFCQSTETTTDRVIEIAELFYNYVKGIKPKQ